MLWDEHVHELIARESLPRLRFSPQTVSVRRTYRSKTKALRAVRTQSVCRVDSGVSDFGLSSDRGFGFCGRHRQQQPQKYGGKRWLKPPSWSHRTPFVGFKSVLESGVTRTSQVGRGLNPRAVAAAIRISNRLSNTTPVSIVSRAHGESISRRPVGPKPKGALVGGLTSKGYQSPGIVCPASGTASHRWPPLF